MDPVSTIVAALAAGAAAAASDTANQAIKDAYQGLKTILSDGYKLVSTALIEKMPMSDNAKKAITEEIQAAPGVMEDSKVLEKTRELQDELERLPVEQLSRYGLDIDALKVGKDLVVERIRDGARIRQADIVGDARFSDISGSGTISGK